MLLEHLVWLLIRVCESLSLDLVLIEEECVLCILEVIIYRLLRLVERIRASL